MTILEIKHLTRHDFKMLFFLETNVCARALWETCLLRRVESALFRPCEPSVVALRALYHR